MEADTGGVVMMISGTVVENVRPSVVAMVVVTCIVLADRVVVVLVEGSGLGVEGTRVMVMVVMAGPVWIVAVVKWAVKTVVFDVVAKVVLAMAEGRRHTQKGGCVREVKCVDKDQQFAFGTADV